MDSCRPTMGAYAAIRSAARLHASQAGLDLDDAEDCASEFVLRLLQESRSEIRSEPVDPTRAGLFHRSARNHARNFRRARASVRQHELPWEEAIAVVEMRVEGRGDDPDIGPPAVLMRAELRRDLAALIEQLLPGQRELFVRHYIRGERLCDLADDLDRTAHALHQSLCCIRKRLRTLADRHGLTEEEARGYLVPY